MLKQLLLFVCLLVTAGMQAQQNVGIGTTTPNASALLDVTATNKGILVPRLTNAQMIAIATPANGLLIYNTDSAAFAYRTATAWVFIKGNVTASNDWNTKGNAGTDTSKNFIGTTDNVDVIFKRNNRRAGLISFSGTSWGSDALNPLSTGILNTALGAFALYSNTGGNENTATGYQALYSNATGSYNTANGDGALFSNTTGGLNTANGYQALTKNTTGVYNTANGFRALHSNITGSYNTANGLEALFSNTTGYSNIAVGIGTLHNNTTRNNLVAIGDSALFNNGTGAAGSSDAIANTAVGSKSQYANQTGYSNSSFGYQALMSNVTGYENTAVGNYSMSSGGAGFSNSAFGYGSLQANNTGYQNVAVGYNALAGNTGGIGNTVVGADAMKFANGNFNTVVGYGAGVNTGSSNIFLGNGAGQNEHGSNKLYISNSSTDAANTLIYGEFDNKLLRSNGRMEINSDNTLNDGLRVIKNYAAGANKNISAVYGENTVDDNWGVGVMGKGGRLGVQGISQGTGNSLTYAGVKGTADGINASANLGVWGQASGSALINRAVAGEAAGSSGEKYGIYGSASGDGTNYAVYGTATGGTTNYAGYFAGNVFTNGKLTVATTAGTTGIDLAGSDAYAEMRVIRNTLNATDKDLYLGFQGPAGSGVHLYSDGSETVTIKSNVVGVGRTPLTSDANSRLQVKQMGNQSGIGVEAAGSTNHWDFWATSNAASNFNLYYNGVFKGVFDNVSGAYTAPSDRRLKKDVSLYQPVLNNVMQLQAYQYHYLDNQPTDRFSNGFMAQDVQKIFPDAVVENEMKDGEKRLGINYQYFTVLAIKGMQEQQHEIELLKEQMNTLIKEVSLLKKQ